MRTGTACGGLEMALHYLHQSVKCQLSDLSNQKAYPDRKVQKSVLKLLNKRGGRVCLARLCTVVLKAIKYWKSSALHFV